MLTGHKIESVAEKHFGSEYGASGYKRVTLPALINFVGEILAAHSAGAQAYPTVEHWLTEIAGEREIGHAIQEMTHMEVARQAWSAARAMTGSAGAQASDSGSDSIAFDYAHKLLSERLGVQSKYDPCDPGNWRDSDDAMGSAAQPQPSAMTDAARDAKRYQWLRAQHEMQDTFEDSEGFTVRSPAEIAWTVFRPGRITSLEPVGCIPGELDSAIDAEIERIDREGGGA